AASCAALREYGTGACGSPLLSGLTDLHRRLEAELSAFLGREQTMSATSAWWRGRGSPAPAWSSSTTTRPPPWTTPSPGTRPAAAWWCWKASTPWTATWATCPLSYRGAQPRRRHADRRGPLGAALRSDGPGRDRALRVRRRGRPDVRHL